MHSAIRSIRLHLVPSFILFSSALLLGTAQGTERLGQTFSFYTSFPAHGGPYILGATWDPTADGGLGALRVVFNEAVEDAEVTDFLAIGFDWAAGGGAVELLELPAADDRRVVELTGFSALNPPEVGDSLAVAAYVDRLPDSDGIQDTGGAVGSDHTHVPITTGALMVSVEIANWAETGGDADNDEIIIAFDAPIAEPAGGWDNVKFSLTPELSAVHPFSNPTRFSFSIGTGGEENVLTITRDASGPHLRQIWPGASKLWIDEDAVTWAAVPIGNPLQAIMVDNQQAGPILLGAHWNEFAGKLWLIFSDVVDEESLGASVEDQYLLGGVAEWGSITPTQMLAFPGYSNVVLISASDFQTGPGAATIQVAAGHELRDEQGEIGPQVQPVPIAPGIGILRVSYDDSNTYEDPHDDLLEIWFSEAVLDPGDVGGEDFAFLPSEDLPPSIWEDLNITVDNQSGYARVWVTGWDDIWQLDGQRLPVGAYVAVRPDSDIRGAQSGPPGGGINTDQVCPVFEDRAIWPASASTLEEIPSLCRKHYDAGPPLIDQFTLAWREIGQSDRADEWLLFFTNQGSALLNDNFIDAYRNAAFPVSDLRSEIVDGGVHRVSVDIAPGTVTTDGMVLMEGDEVWFMLVPCTYWGSLGESAASLHFESGTFVGALCPVFDYWADIDDDLIHLRAIREGETRTYAVWGDRHSAPCGDSVHVFGGSDPLHDILLGSGSINSDCSFGPVELTPEANTLPLLYVFSEYHGVFGLPPAEIINDTADPSLLLDENGTPGEPGDDFIAHADRFNPYRIYTKDDYINILLRARDGAPGAPDALSDLLAVTADFTQVDERVVLPSGDSLHAVPLVSLGADMVDNDGDWVDTDLDGVMDFPEPYCDENGDGAYDLGETFWDCNANDLYDGPGGSGGDYDLNLDSADPDEHGWYEINLGSPADTANVVKGFCVEDPYTDPTGQQGFPELHDLPVNLTLWDPDLDVSVTYDEEHPSPAVFACEIDEGVPTVSLFTELYSPPGFETPSNPDSNLIVPYDPTYHLGQFANFKIETPSDFDVLFLVIEIYQDRTGEYTWEPLTLDPPGENGHTGVPGIAVFDDDRDVESDSLLTNGLDDDEDGEIDEEGEGIDWADPEVVDAVQDSIADAAAPGGDGIYRENDRRDNDNDAFFVFHPYYDIDGAGSQIPIQSIVWFNIDESTYNNIDDDGDGYIDEVDEVETYDGTLDDSEDGIIDGEEARLVADGVRVLIVSDSTYVGDFFVDAAHMLGEHPADLDGDIRALTEVIPLGYEILDPNGILTQPFPGLGWGDSLSHREFFWFDTHGSTNLDLHQIAGLYHMAVNATTEYQLRGVAYDQAGLADTSYAIPITFTIGTGPSPVTEPDELESFRLDLRCTSPFAPTSALSYSIPHKGHVSLYVHDIQGRRMAALVNGVMDPGWHRIHWDGRGSGGVMLASGVYFLRLEHGQRANVRRILLTP